VFSSTETAQLHDAGKTISTGRNQTLVIDYGEANQLADSLKTVPNVIRITNKGPASTLQLSIENGTAPLPLLFQLTTVVSVADSTLSFQPNETIPVDMRFNLLTLITLGGTYTGSLKATDVTTGMTFSIPIRLHLNLLI
jgi:hypothetical protein